MNERTRWTEDENTRLQAAALPLLVADAHMKVVEAVRRVQDTVLAPDRRRDLKNIGAVPHELRQALEMRRAAAMGSADVVPVAALKAAEQREQVLSVKLGEVCESMRLMEAARAAAAAERENLLAHIRTLEAMPKAPGALEVLKEFCSDVLAQAMAKSKAVPGVHLPAVAAPPPVSTSDVLAAAANLAVDSTMAVVRNGKHNSEPTPSGKAKLPVLLIGGMKPHQRAYFESKFGNRARIKWWLDEAYALLGDKAKGADMVFMLMGNVSHDAVQLAMKNCDNVQRVATHNQEQIAGLVEGWLKRLNGGAAGHG